MKIPIFHTVTAILRRSVLLARDCGGNVLMLFAFSLVPIAIATGMGIDYARAMRLQTKMNAAADAAALAAVSDAVMDQSVDTAKFAAQLVFIAQTRGLTGSEGMTINYADASQFSVVVTEDSSGTSNKRTATVSYAATSANAFASLLGRAVLNIKGSAVSTASEAPNIDFYIALDTSPSMALPTTSDGFDIMDKAMKCAFACHTNKAETALSTPILDNATFGLNKGNFGTATVGGQQVTKIDKAGSYIYNSATTTFAKCKGSGDKNICVYNSDNTYADSYWYALNKGVRLRVTDEKAAIGDLMDLAKSYSQQNKKTYRAALYTFDHLANIGNSTKQTLTSDLSLVATKAGTIDVATVNDKEGGGCPATGCASDNRYLFTSFYGILNKMLNGPDGLPTQSGKGTSDPNDTPQAFMFVVTDGMSDENIGSGRTRAEMQKAQIDQCATIKARGVKIAILYTEYTTDSIKDDEPNQRAIATKAIPKIPPALQKCASSTDLVYTVKTDESISEALKTLFSKAIATARLAQ